MRAVKLALLLLPLLVVADRLLPVVFSQSAAALPAPARVDASDGAYSTKVGIWWDAVAGATTYRIFRNAVNDPAAAVEVGSTAAPYFFDQSVPAAQTFFYWVRAEDGGTVSALAGPDQGIRAAGVINGTPPLNPPPTPAGNPLTASKAYLGKALFWDEQLSSTRTVACGTCHQAGNGGSDMRVRVADARTTNPGADGVFGTADDVYASPGVPVNHADGSLDWSSLYGLGEQVTGRKAASYINAGYANVLFWDGRASGTFTDPLSGAVVLPAGAALESQVLGPPVNSAEMAHTGRNWSDVATRVAQSKPLALSPSVPAALQDWIGNRSYAELFSEAFGTSDVTPARIAEAIATFERTLFSDRTPFDMSAAGIAPLTDAQQRGLNVFRQSRCDTCHAGPLFSDNQFHNIGLRPQTEDTGRFQVTGAANNLGEFRTPSLRNVGLRAPYMHNGHLASLEEVVEFYNRGGDFPAPNVDRNRIRPLNLSPQQKADLVEFLRGALTDPRVAAQTAPFDRPLLYTESSRVPQIVGAGINGSGGVVPQVVAKEPPLVGNPSFTVGLYLALGGAQAVLVINATDPGASASIPATASFARVVVSVAGSGARQGYASATLSLPDDARLVGATLYGRWYVQDAGAAGGVAVTPAFKMTLFGIGVAAPEPAIAITDATISGKNLLVSGKGFERGDVIEINGQSVAATKFIDATSLNVKKGARLLTPCGPANPTGANTIKLLRTSGGSPVVVAAWTLSLCP